MRRHIYNAVGQDCSGSLVAYIGLSFERGTGLMAMSDEDQLKALRKRIDSPR